MPEILKLVPLSVRLDMPVSRLRKWALGGKIPAFRTGLDKGAWLFDVEEVENAIKQMGKGTA